MNELRIYVEHLFEGRMLTAEMIELKEEMYGNLVARYEDYVASGMSKAEALEKTKASLTSIEDVLSEDGAAAAKAAGTAKTTVLPSGGVGAGASGAASTTKMPAAGGGANPPTPPAGMASAASAGQPDQSAASQGADKPARKKWPIVVGVVAGVLVLAVAATLALGLWVPGANTAQQSTQQTAVQGTGNGPVGNDSSQDDNADDAGVSNGATTNNGAGAGGGTGQGSGFGYAYGQRHHHDVDDYDDQVEYEQSLALLNALDGVTAATLKSMAEGNTTFEQMFRALPLGDFVESVGQDQGATAVNVRYANVLEAFDDDALDCALVFNAVAIMAMRPDVQSVAVVVHEQGDGAYDTDAYQFKRTALESGFSNHHDCGFTTIDASMIASDDAWARVCACLTNGNFCERHCDLAEIDD